MNSPVVSLCDPGIRSSIKCFGVEDGKTYQTCDILIQVQEDLKLVFFLSPSVGPEALYFSFDDN